MPCTAENKGDDLTVFLSADFCGCELSRFTVEFRAVLYELVPSDVSKPINSFYQYWHVFLAAVRREIMASNSWQHAAEHTPD